MVPRNALPNAQAVSHTSGLHGCWLHAGGANDSFKGLLFELQRRRVCAFLSGTMDLEKTTFSDRLPQSGEAACEYRKGCPQTAGRTRRPGGCVPTRQAVANRLDRRVAERSEANPAARSSRSRSRARTTSSRLPSGNRTRHAARTQQTHRFEDHRIGEMPRRRNAASHWERSFGLSCRHITRVTRSKAFRISGQVPRKRHFGVTLKHAQNFSGSRQFSSLALYRKSTQRHLQTYLRSQETTTAAFAAASQVVPLQYVPISRGERI